MEMWILWLIVAGVLLIVEVCTQMMWSLCLAVGALGAIVASFFGVAEVWQVVVLALTALAAYVVGVPLFQKWHILQVDMGGNKVRTGMDALLGRRAFLVEEIRADRPGRARIDGDCWQVQAPRCATPLPCGTEVVVTGYHSIILEVEPIGEAPSSAID